MTHADRQLGRGENRPFGAPPMPPCVVGNIGASIQQVFGGNITLYTELCEHARTEAFDIMVDHAKALGANAVIGMRYDANDVTEGATEVPAYGTAAVIEPAC